MQKRHGWNVAASVALPLAMQTVASIVVCLLIVLAPIMASAQQPPPKTSDAELADRFESLAFLAGSMTQPSAPAVREMGTFLEAAHRLNPTEERYPRMLARLRLQTGDTAGAVAALTAYLTIAPDDQVGQTQLIDLYVGRMQTADSILKYLRSIVAKTALPKPVRSHAAVLCAQTLLDHAQQDEAIKMLNTALAIEPLDPPALRLKYRFVQDQGPAARCGMLLAMLRANPVDPESALALANELANLGLAEDSVLWYAAASNLYGAVGGARSSDLAKGGATELLLSGHPDDAAGLIASYLLSISGDADGWAIRLAAAKDASNDRGRYDHLLRQALIAVTNRLQNIRTAIGAQGATTQPIDLASQAAPPTTLPLTEPTAGPIPDAPDVSGDLPLLMKSNQPQLTDSYISAIGDLAWLRLCFARDAGNSTQGLIDELARMLPPDDPLLQRLMGWAYLVRGEWAQARKTLSTLTDHDAYAAAGIVLLDDQDGHKKEADVLARSTLAIHPSGCQAALVYSLFHARGAKIIPTSKAQAVKAAVDTFPRDWLNIVAQPESFYGLTLEPVEDQVSFGQAVLFRLTIQNLSEFDLALGSEGTIRPDLVFDASCRGLIEKDFPGYIYDQFWRRLVLLKGQSASQIFRLDRGGLAQVMQQQVAVPIDVQFTVTTNPLRSANGPVAGGAGIRRLAPSLFERSATPLIRPDDQKQLYDRLTGGSAGQRLCAAETAIIVAQNLHLVAKGPQAQQANSIAHDLLDHAAAVTADADPAVKAWANYLEALISPADQKTAMVQRLTLSDDWYSRMLGLLAAAHLPDHGAIVAQALSNDRDPIVKEFDAAMMEDIATLAAQQQTPQATPPAQ